MINDNKINNQVNTYLPESKHQTGVNLQMNSSKNRINKSNQQYPHLNHTPSIKKFINNTKHPRYQVNGHNQSRTISNTSHRIQSNSFIYSEKIIQLQEKLKNIHIFYKSKIENEKSRTHQRNEVFISISQELLKSHSEKILNLKALHEQAQIQKKDVGLVDERMNEIKASIDEILKQSSNLKQSNQNFTRQIQERQNRIRKKQEELSKLKNQLIESRDELQKFQRTNLKQNKKNKDILGMIQKMGNSKLF